MRVRVQLQHVITVLGALIIVLATAGCMQYNGAFGGPEGGDSKQAREYRKFQEQLAKDRATAKRQNTAVMFPDGTTAGGHSAQAHTGGAGTTPVTYTPAAPLRGMGLYGHLPQTQPQVTSPLDSPQNVVQITFVDEGADFDPDIDPTGAQMVFASTRHRKTSDIYLKKINGTTTRQLTNDPGNDVMPCFSPDGKWVAFASDRTGNWDIYLLPLDGNGQARQVTNSQMHEIHPSFSSDGQKLVFSSYGAQSGVWEIVVMDLANPAKKEFIAHGLFPNWSPKDNRIVFQRARERGSRWFSIWTVTYEGGEAKRPTEIAASSNAAAITPDWSPDGESIVFCTVVDPQADENGAKPPQADVWMIAADGSSRTNLTRSNRFVNLQPVWAQGGTIYFVSNRGRESQENVWAVRPDANLRVVQQPQPAPTPAPQGATANVPTGPSK